MPATLRVGSYNVHGCLGLDRRRDVDRIARVVGGIGADAMGLQEVDSRHDAPGHETQPARLARLTGMELVDGPILRTASGAYGNALLTRRPVHRVRRCDLSIVPYEPRGAVEALLECDGGVIRIAVTHLGLRGAERRLQVERLLDWLGEAREPLVLVGDLNEWRPRGYIDRRIAACLTPALRLRTFPARFPTFALDRIAVSGDLAVGDVAVERNADARVASDHLPIHASVRLLSPLTPRSRAPATADA